MGVAGKGRRRDYLRFQYMALLLQVTWLSLRGDGDLQFAECDGPQVLVGLHRNDHAVDSLALVELVHEH